MDDHGNGGEVNQHVIREHRHLENLFDVISNAFRDGARPDDLQKALARLAGALETHFEQEDDLYFPAIRTLCPGLSESLRNLGLGHDRFRDELRRVADHIGHDDLAGASQVFNEIRELFDLHESTEERMLAELETELRR